MSSTLDLDTAVQFIKSGNIVAFPTETVYGLGADATNEQACQKIFKIKGRPNINPLIVHVANIKQAKNIGEFNDDADKLASILWPGPLTIIVPLKSNNSIAPSVLAGLRTVALRMPAHDTALELIKQSGVLIAAPSANFSGYVSSTMSEHVIKDFSHEKDVFILENKEKSQYGIESTIIDTTSQNLTILRSGFITSEAIAKIVGKKIVTEAGLMEIKAPGMMDKHYSPKVKLRLNADNLQPNEIGLNFANSKLVGEFSLNLSGAGDLIEAASNLYLSLRILDNYAELNNISFIAVAVIPNIGVGIAINDRLTRASK
jgi:L-threonylcarbamoyladenylate synthase